MRILILSNYPWKNNNSFGNTYSSIFGQVPNTEIAHIYMFDGTPDSVTNVTRYYQILEKDVMRSVFRRGAPVGREVFVDNKDFSLEPEITNKNEHKSLYGKLLAFGKQHHWNSLFFAREVAWKCGKVDYDGLMNFVNDFKPDIFFLPFSNVYYTNRIALYIKKNINIPMVVEMAMDHYTLKRVSWNPFFWLDRFGKRRMIRQLAKQSELFFAISKKLRDELEDSLHIPCKVLYKTPNKNRSSKQYMPNNETVSFLFTGNIYSNRWKSLALLARELKNQQFGHLDIYTASPITPKIDKALNIDGYSSIHPPISQNEVIRLQNEADVLVHTEAFDKFNKSLVRCAISTKIMDYLSVGRCILAIGPSDISSIEYLVDNDVALVADSKDRLSEQIERIKNDKSIITAYAAKSHDYVIQKLDEDKIRKDFYNVLQQVIDNYNN